MLVVSSVPFLTHSSQSCHTSSDTQFLREKRLADPAQRSIGASRRRGAWKEGLERESGRYRWVCVGCSKYTSSM